MNDTTYQTQRIDELEDKILETAQEGFYKSQKSMEKQIKEIHDCIFGNGRAGLVERVAASEVQAKANGQKIKALLWMAGVIFAGLVGTKLGTDVVVPAFNGLPEITMSAPTNSVPRLPK